MLNILHINSRSLPRNFDEMLTLLNSFSTYPDILGITKTWLSNINKDHYHISGYHSYHLTRSLRPHGGVTLFVSNKLQSDQLTNFTIINDDIEINTVKITSNNFNFIVRAIYRPNSKHIGVDEFTNTLTSLLYKDHLRKNKVIIIGDLNINLLEHTSHTPTNNFLSSLQSIIFFPHISRPTRFPDNENLSEPSLLDHVYTNFNCKFSSGILHYPISDHLPIFMCLFFL